MKTMTCKQLGGACDTAFTAANFEELATLSKKHAMEMFKNGDAAHIEAMNKMQERMRSAAAMQTWLSERRKGFESLPDNS